MLGGAGRKVIFSQTAAQEYPAQKTMVAPWPGGPPPESLQAVLAPGRPLVADELAVQLPL